MPDDFVKMAAVGQDDHLVVGQVDQVIILPHTTTILSCFTMRNAIAAETEARKQLEQKKSDAKGRRAAKSAQTKPIKLFKETKSRKRVGLQLDSESSDDADAGDFQLPAEDSEPDDKNDIIEGDFVITKIDGKKVRSILYRARVEAIDDDGYEGVFLRKVPSHLR